MFERYTASARRVLFYARWEASKLGSLSIEPEHLLLGVLRSRMALRHHLSLPEELSYKAALTEIRTQAPPRKKVSTSIEIPFTESAKRTLHAAAGEADALDHSYIGTEHLLLGLLNLEGGTTKAILERHGLRLDDVRRDIRERVAGALNAAPPYEDY